MIERVVVSDDWQNDGHAIYVLGRSHPGAPRGVLQPDGEWLELDHDNSVINTPTLRLPADALDMLVAARVGVAAPNTALADALADTRTVRDRLLTIIEREASTTVAYKEDRHA